MKQSNGERVRSIHAHLQTGAATREEIAVSLAELDAERIPLYPSYHLVRAECLIALGQFVEAQHALRIALKLAPNSPLAALLLESITSADLFAAAQIEIDTTETVSPDEASVPTSEMEMPHGFSAVHSPATIAPHGQPIIHAMRPKPELGTLGVLFGDVFEPHPCDPLEGFDLQTTARELSRNPPSLHVTRESDEQVDDDQSPLQESELVSETLAGILLGQGKLQEAMNAYRQLQKSEPSRAEYFRARVELLEAKLHS